MIVRCLLVMLASIYAQADLEFIWSERDARFNSVVGIAVKGQPVSAGVFISSTLVLTSSNPLSDYSDPKQISVYSVSGKFDAAYKHEVVCIVHLHRKTDWVHIPSDKNSPVHDLAILGIADESSLQERAKEISSENHRPFAVRIMSRAIPYYKKGPNNTIVPETYAGSPGAPNDLMSAGFAFVDRAHVQRSMDLEILTHGNDEIVDCDNYIPRKWGNFICVFDKNSYVGIESGQPLFTDGQLLGIGSFTVQKGKEVIHVFTNMIIYANSLPTQCDPQFYSEPETTTTKH